MLLSFSSASCHSPDFRSVRFEIYAFSLLFHDLMPPPMMLPTHTLHGASVVFGSGSCSSSPFFASISFVPLFRSWGTTFTSTGAFRSYLFVHHQSIRFDYSAVSSSFPSSLFSSSRIRRNSRVPSVDFATSNGGGCRSVGRFVCMWDNSCNSRAGFNPVGEEKLGRIKKRMNRR